MQVRRAGGATTALVRIVLRLALTRSRVLSLAALGALAVLLGLAVRVATEVDRVGAGFDLVEDYCLGLVTPVTALVLSSAALGDLVEDGTLVHLWLRPVARWRIAVAALVASCSAALPLTLVPNVVAAAVADVDSRLVVGAALTTVLAVLAYASTFVALGLVVRRALPWGLAYVLIWEGAVARVSTGAARLSIQIYARTLLARLADVDPPRPRPSSATCIVVLLVVTVVGAALTTWWLNRRDVA